MAAPTSPSDDSNDDDNDNDSNDKFDSNYDTVSTIILIIMIMMIMLIVITTKDIVDEYDCDWTSLRAAGGEAEDEEVSVRRAPRGQEPGRAQGLHYTTLHYTTLYYTMS